MPRNGNTTARGYGAQHQSKREKLAPTVATGTITCARCGLLIAPGQPWDLGHTDDRTSWTGPEHRRCNRVDGTRKTNASRRSRRQARQTPPTPTPTTLQPITSRQWWTPPAAR
jgi:hypothetical protein